MLDRDKRTELVQHFAGRRSSYRQIVASCNKYVCFGYISPLRGGGGGGYFTYFAATI